MSQARGRGWNSEGRQRFSSHFFVRLEALWAKTQLLWHRGGVLGLLFCVRTRVMAPAVCALLQVTLFVRGREGVGLRPGGSGAGRGVSGVPHKHEPLPLWGYVANLALTLVLGGRVPCGLAPLSSAVPVLRPPSPSPSPATLSPSPARRWEDPEAGGLRGGRQGWGALLAALWDGALPCRLCAKGVEAVGLGLGGGFWFQG